MTTSDYKKILTQIKKKPAKYKKYLKHNVPVKRKFGKSVEKCRRCGRSGAHISSYGLHLCRQCFREIAVKLGFRKYS
ncbi:MAG: 30S ribosomal protein S14 [Nanoarchaeota archaeon]|nr:30S ribosomal protein S14 [Nanoarchaeota archaeon]MBU1030521.1 30S ribosomal protein S14 [Nanoarchaeota archaeon]MBU1850219.1 30S ribosomal protein S14 [Nanoarchaeota archaeon]